MNDLRGKRVLVTGASSGIGAAVARGFAARGALVAVHGRDRGRLAAVCGRIREAGFAAEAVAGDLTVRDEAHRVVEEARTCLGGLDVLVNNAGTVVKRVAFAEALPEDMRAIVDVNIWSVLHACEAALPGFIGRKSGNIINTISVAARSGGGRGSILYAASKGFVATLTRGLAKEVARHNIRVNAVAPGVIDTPLHHGLTPPAVWATMADAPPLGRAGRAEECVGAYLFLASDAMSSYVTGDTITVDGGLQPR